MTEPATNLSQLDEDAAPAVQVGDLRTAWRDLHGWLAEDGRGGALLLTLILLVAAYLRLTNINWDLGTHVHPDENFLTMVTSAMKLPQSVGEFFDSTKSPMNPYNLGYGLFVYGTLPIFIVRVAAEAANVVNQAARLWTFGPGAAVEMTSYGAVYLVGRALSALFDLASVWLLYILARRLYGHKVGIVAAALYAFAALPLQQSHFYTVDTFGTFFALAAFYLAVRVAQGTTFGGYVALGAALGATVACRINLAPLVLIALLAVGIRAWAEWRALPGATSAPAGLPARERFWFVYFIQATLFRVLVMGLVAIAVFRMAQPYAFGGTSLLDFSLAQKWLENMRDISRTMALDVEMPPTHQWANRTPFVFPLVNIVVWGMGAPLGVAAWTGWLAALWQVVRGLTRRSEETRKQGDKATGDGATWPAHMLPVAWIGGMFLWQGLQAVQSMRYMLPLYPLLAMMAAWGVWALVDGARRRNNESADQRITHHASHITYYASRLRASLTSSRASIPLAYTALVVVVIGAVLWGWGFMAIYRRPMTRVAASRWMYANIPPGSHIGVENWDEALPLGVDGKNGYSSGMYLGLSSGEGGSMPMVWEDTQEKRAAIYRWLNEADYLVVSSNRRWASAPRMPLRFPMTIRYYELLFAGKLGFKQVYHVASFPTVFGIQFNDNSAEEAFSVYDHPQVFIFQKTPEYSEALLRSYLDGIDLEQVIPLNTKQASASPTALYLTADEAAQQQAGGTWSEIFNLDGLVNRSPAAAVLVWLLLLELLGLLAFAMTFVAFRSLADRGYGVAKILGALLLAWLSWLAPALKLAPYERWWIMASLGLLAGVAGMLAWRRRTHLAAFVRGRAALLLTEEALFLALFVLFLLIRIGNPDLWHPARGGEKPMELAYLNAVIRSTTFPPYDPWHAGGYLNYYYFGFVIVGTLIKLTAIVPWVAYNLAVPALFALTGLGAFAVVYSLVEGDPAAAFPGEEAEAGGGLRVGPLLAGLAGAFFVAIAGNLGNLELIAEQLAARSELAFQSSIPGLAALVRGLDGLRSLVGGGSLQFPNDWWFWNASRIIPDTINEFPFFTFVYADLHAHMIALPLTLLGLACAAAIVRNRYRGLGIGDSDTSSNTQYPIAESPHREPSPWCLTLGELLPLLLLGLTAGALRATNTWDFPTYLLVGGLALAAREWARRAVLWRALETVDLEARLAFLFRSGVAVLWRAVILTAVAIVTFYPYSRYYATAYAGLQAWNEAKTQIPDYLIVHGFFLALIVIYLVSELGAQTAKRKTKDENGGSGPAFILGPSGVSYVLAAMIVVLAGGLALKAQVWLLALPLATLAAVLAFGRDLPPQRRLALLLIALGLAITMGVEVVRQKDDIGRMNTVFKFYVQAWVLMAVGSAAGLGSWANRALSWRPGWRRLAWALTAALFVGVILYPAFAARAKIRDRFSAEASPSGLDGMAYMERAQYSDNNRDLRLADDRAAMLWMMQSITGSPVILEAQTPEYRWGSRFSIYTGLPAVQGWNWHQRQQRSVAPAVVERRVNHVREIYETADLARARKLLETYRVSYIVVGELERAYYNARGLAKFEALVSQGYLVVAYRGGAVTIYEVVGGGVVVGPEKPQGVGPQPVPTPTAPASRPLIFESPVK